MARGVLEEWDKGGRVARLRILSAFLERSGAEGGAEPEAVLGSSASLLLARVLSWLRLSLSSRRAASLSLQLRAVEAFLSAASGARFVDEFVCAGGALAMLDALAREATLEEDRRHCVAVLRCVAGAGRNFKEYVCKHGGVARVAECLLRAREEETLACCAGLLISLGTGNPRYVSVLQEHLLDLFRSAGSPQCKRFAAKALCDLLEMGGRAKRGSGGGAAGADDASSLPEVREEKKEEWEDNDTEEDEVGGAEGQEEEDEDDVTASKCDDSVRAGRVAPSPRSSFQADSRYVDVTVLLLFVDDLRVHHEAYRLLSVLIERHSMTESVVHAMNDVMADPECAFRVVSNDTTAGGGAASQRRGSMNSAGGQGQQHHQLCPPRACAARMLGRMLDLDKGYASRIAAKGSVRLLLQCLTDVSHLVTQQSAAAALARLVAASDAAERTARSELGDDLYERFVSGHESAHRNPTMIAAVRERLQAGSKEDAPTSAAGTAAAAAAAGAGPVPAAGEGGGEAGDEAAGSSSSSSSSKEEQGGGAVAEVVDLDLDMEETAGSPAAAAATALAHGDPGGGGPRRDVQAAAEAVSRSYVGSLGLPLEEHMTAEQLADLRFRPSVYRPYALPAEAARGPLLGRAGGAGDQAAQPLEDAYLEMHFADGLNPHKQRQLPSEARNGMLLPHSPAKVEVLDTGSNRLQEVIARKRFQHATAAHDDEDAAGGAGGSGAEPAPGRPRSGTPARLATREAPPPRRRTGRKSGERARASGQGGEEDDGEGEAGVTRRDILNVALLLKGRKPMERSSWASRGGGGGGK